MFIHAPNKPDAQRKLAASGHQVRAHNEATLLRMIWDAQTGISRAELSRRSGLARSTVSDIVSRLVQADLVHPVPVVARSRGGRPPTPLRFREDRFAVVGVELGGGHLSCVRTDLRGQLEHHASYEWPVLEDPEAALQRLEELVAEALVPVTPERSVVGLGVAVPCPLEVHTPGQLSTRILPHWSGIAVADRLYRRFGLPVLMDNDANLGALAEAWWGGGRGVPHFTYVKVGTGVGAGHIIGGEIFRGAAGIAGEIGHSAVNRGGRRCRCGLRGCLEAEVGSRAILEQVRERLARGEASVLKPDAQLSGVVAAARSGDPLAAGVIGEAGHNLGVALANLVNLMNPARIVLGGRVTSAGDLLLRPLRRALSERALASSVEGTEVRVSELVPGAVARGAATLVLRWALDHMEVLTAPADPPEARAFTRLLDSRTPLDPRAHAGALPFGP